ncbi:MAG: DUF362 domain-containing protein [Candidatus Omnitrophica bacterium]|nr:DUF362 domain-containing protein [Candidatus Omnitrophota bacterium]
MERRDFIKRGVITIIGLGFSGIFKGRNKGSLFAEEGFSEIAVARGGSVKDLTARAVNGLGGMAKFVKKGSKVVIKPNIAWNRVPEKAATTHPEVVAALVTLCRECGAGEVVVTDNPCNPWNATCVTSGIKEAAEKAGAIVNTPLKFKKVTIPGAQVLKEAEVLEDVLNADMVINVPVVKVHGGARVTIAMKNLMGVVRDRGFFHRTDLHLCIAEISRYVRPGLTVLDATRILLTKGPQGDGEIKQTGIVAAGTDFVALDAYGSGLLGIDPQSVRHITIASSMKLGIADMAKVKIKNV